MEERQTLKKTLKPHWVWAIALGSAIGWGAFVQPTTWMADAGPLGVIIGFSIGALLMMLIAVSYGFLIKSFPVSGGEFAYAYISLGRTHAFISGWFLALGYICIVALNASAFALMIKFVFPAVIENLHLYTIAGWDVYGMEIIIASAALGIFGYFNTKGTGLSGQIQFIFACVMVVGVIALTFMVGGQPGAGLSNIHPSFPTNTTAFAAIISIVAIAPWAYVGFDAVPQAAEEFDFPAKKAFTLIILALLFAAILYSLMIIATSMTGPWQDLVAENHIWGTGFAIQDVVGTMGLIILVTALTMGVFTGLNGFILATSRLLFAMSRAKILPSAFSRLHPKHETPYIAVIFTVVVSMLAPWFGREALTWVVDMSSIGVSIAYLYTCFTAFKLFKWSKDKDFIPSKHEVSPFKKTYSGIGVIASLIFICLLLIPGSPAFLGIESRIALGLWILLGIIFYFAKRKEFNRIPKEELNYLILGDKEIKPKRDE
ncbi:APC family permease [Virgibacillus alimentarius]|uniref:APC family permease n=1 Tax=Virgibacillus alimentarius TaxID=698769 RepID=UPI000492F3A2|nr:MULTISPECIES: APC family permease [Virgibacillus]HLR67443.1 APC family permease [Virgibacillus sp.]